MNQFRACDIRQNDCGRVDCHLSLPMRGIFLVLSAFLLFAHGCHGDEDTELWGYDKMRTAEVDQDVP